MLDKQFSFALWLTEVSSHYHSCSLIAATNFLLLSRYRVAISFPMRSLPERVVKVRLTTANGTSEDVSATAHIHFFMTASVVEGSANSCRESTLYISSAQMDFVRRLGASLADKDWFKSYPDTNADIFEDAAEGSI